jgi:hypothetical protein
VTCILLLILLKLIAQSAVSSEMDSNVLFDCSDRCNHPCSCNARDISSSESIAYILKCSINYTKHQNQKLFRGSKFLNFVNTAEIHFQKETYSNAAAETSSSRLMKQQQIDEAAAE